MRISIVIPAYNAARYLGYTIEGVLAQTVTDWELVVVDDGSADETAAVARAFAGRDKRIRVVGQANAGVGNARNRGFELTTGSGYVIFLDADDVWEADALAVLCRSLNADTKAVAAYGLSRYIDGQGQSCFPGDLEEWGRARRGVAGNHLIAWPSGHPTTLAVLAHRNTIYTPGQALIRRSALLATGPFDPAAAPCEDWDMWLRLSLHGEIAFVDRVILNYRTHDSNMSRDRERMAKGQVYVRRKLLLSQEMSSGQRAVVLAANWLWCRRVSAAG